MSEEEIDELRRKVEGHKQFIDQWTEISIEAESVFCQAVAYAISQIDRVAVEQKTSNTVLALLLSHGRHCAEDISQQGHDLTIRRLNLLEQRVRAFQQNPNLLDTLRSSGK